MSTLQGDPGAHAPTQTEFQLRAGKRWCSPACSIVAKAYLRAGRASGAFDPRSTFQSTFRRGETELVIFVTPDRDAPDSPLIARRAIDDKTRSTSRLSSSEPLSSNVIMTMPTLAVAAAPGRCCVMVVPYRRCRRQARDHTVDRTMSGRTARSTASRKLARRPHARASTLTRGAS